MLLLLVACGGDLRHHTQAAIAPGPGAEALSPEIVALLEAARTKPHPGPRHTRHQSPDGQPLFTNRLALEASPYLRSHAHNPVDWYPWGDEAFALAARLGRPVLLSIGYSTCHWCHVMAEESFEDLEIAQFINEHYVAIKVDREERPDIDAVYMAAMTAITGRGGWPMTLWLTPDRKPFYATTYLPARDGDRGVAMGFQGLLASMSRAYRDDPEQAMTAANDLVRHLSSTLGGLRPVTAPSPPESLTAVTETLRERYDPVAGGARGAQKFPSAFPIRFLLRQHRTTGDPALLDMVTHTLRAMARGGLQDQLGGGFHRYTTDDRWLVPHFEKMLYDNALLAMAYTEAWQVTGDPLFERVARDTLDFVSRDLTSPEGAFWSALDADSLSPETGAREEGRFYTWTRAEIEAALGEQASPEIIAWYAVPPGEERVILHTPTPLAEIAAERQLSEEALAASLARARQTLLTARDRRPKPARDEKILTAWNGLMISALARAASAFGDSELTTRASRAADFVLTQMRDGQRLVRSFGGDVRPRAVLEDYAFLVAALLDLFEATGDIERLEQAIALDQTVLERFEDPAGAWFRTPDDGEVLIAREKPDSDGAEPSGSSVHVLSLLRLAALTGDDRYRQRAVRAQDALHESIARGRMPEMLVAVDFMRETPKEIVLVTPHADGTAAPFLRTLARAVLPNHVLVVISESSPASDAIAALVPWVSEKHTIDGLTTAYVCQGGVCTLPTTDLAVFERLISPRDATGSSPSTLPSRDRR